MLFCWREDCVKLSLFLVESYLEETVVLEMFIYA